MILFYVVSFGLVAYWLISAAVDVAKRAGVNAVRDGSKAAGGSGHE